MPLAPRRSLFMGPSRSKSPDSEAERLLSVNPRSATLSSAPSIRTLIDRGSVAGVQPRGMSVSKLSRKVLDQFVERETPGCVDLASQPANTAVCVITWSHDSAEVRALASGMLPTERIMSSPRPTRYAPRSQAFSPCRGSHPGIGCKRRHHPEPGPAAPASAAARSRA
jgi:hypothetical protein